MRMLGLAYKGEVACLRGGLSEQLDNRKPFLRKGVLVSMWVCDVETIRKIEERNFGHWEEIMPSKKIACLGGGSMYFRGALADLAVTEGLAGSEITLYDIDREKVELMGRLGARLADLSGTGLRVRVCSDLADAVDGADFAVSSIGGAGKSGGHVYGTSLHKQDLLIPARYGIYQLVGDTGGPAGMMMGPRNIPS